MKEWPDLPEMLTVDEVADFLRVSDKTIRRMLTDGRLAGVNLGRSWRIPRQALAAMLAQAGVPSP
ncbi:MAG: helix-turn-helix domain-containing protein [Clostridia bacterium]|nr:helix-turn-helix domain-containing protein [Clostridia bacterium]